MIFWLYHKQSFVCVTDKEKGLAAAFPVTLSVSYSMAHKGSISYMKVSHEIQVEFLKHVQWQ